MRKINVILAVLFAGAFVMGCAEMLVVGLLDLIAADLRVPESAAGALVTANALGLAIGGPLLTFLTARLNRRHVIIATGAIFVVLNLLPALGAGLPLFLVARVAIGAAQGLFTAAAFTIAVAIVPPERVGRAMGIIISGFASASAFGLPAGTLLGQAVGWRGAFVAVVVVAAAVLVLAIIVTPSVPTPPESRALGQLRHAFSPRVVAVLAVCFVIFVALQSALTYIVPFLGEVSGIAGPTVTLFLLAYGVATTVGSFGGGRFADSNAGRTLVVGTIGLLAALVVLFALGANPVFAAIAIAGMGLFAMGMAPSMQHRVVAFAESGGPLASALPASAVNAGAAVGSLAGGVAFDAAGVAAPVGLAVIISVVAIGAAVATGFIKEREKV